MYTKKLQRNVRNQSINFIYLRKKKNSLKNGECEEECRTDVVKWLVLKKSDTSLSWKYFSYRLPEVLCCIGIRQRKRLINRHLVHSFHNLFFLQIRPTRNGKWLYVISFWTKALSRPKDDTKKFGLLFVSETIRIKHHKHIPFRIEVDCRGEWIFFFFFFFLASRRRNLLTKQ